jgi:LAS superfamily LD-carboxypeptidase LdcB
MTPAQQLVLGFKETLLVDVCAAHKLHPAIINDWHALVLGANNDGIDLTIASAFRSYGRQQLIFNNKAHGRRPVNDENNQPIDINAITPSQLLKNILHWSALPGASRHHWGTDIDVYAPSMLTQELLLEPWEYDAGGPMERLGYWLDENLANYGFYRPYVKYNGGVAREPWHISHIRESQNIEKSLNIQLLKETIIANDIGLKEEVLSMLDTIYKQYIINVERP